MLQERLEGRRQDDGVHVDGGPLLSLMAVESDTGQVIVVGAQGAFFDKMPWEFHNIMVIIGL
jgi:hypothetical protein